MKRDTQIFDLIDKECHRQKEGLELIASENFVSEQVMQAMGSCLTNKYAEGYPGARYYGGCQIVDQTEQLAIDRACQLFGAEFANVQPHSGAQANAAVFFACMKPGDTFLGLDLAHGGHLSHGSPVNLSGINYHPVAYHVKEETGMEVKKAEYLFSLPNIYVYSGFTVHTLDLFFRCTVTDTLHYQAMDYAAAVFFLPLKDIHTEDFGLSSIRKGVGIFLKEMGE